MKTLGALIAALLIFGMGYLSAAVAERGNSPALYCGVAEDDCRPDYQGNGKWSVLPNGK